MPQALLPMLPDGASPISDRVSPVFDSAILHVPSPQGFRKTLFRRGTMRCYPEGGVSELIVQSLHARGDGDADGAEHGTGRR
jgi:hypothetical protein